MQFSTVPALVLAMVLSSCAAITHDKTSAFEPDSMLHGFAPASEFQADLVLLRRVDHRGSNPIASFATYGQCQIDLPLRDKKGGELPTIREDNVAKIHACIAAAEKEHVNVLILPELALAFDEITRRTLIDELKEVANRNSMVVFAGSYYDSQRFSRLVVIGPDWYEEGYKIHPSRYEASPAYGLGMRLGLNLLLIDTPYGRILPITCVDLISDAIQYQARNLVNRSQLDVILNLNYNPASWEFLIEANSIARRHGVFVTITNISAWPSTKEVCQREGDNGLCGGNTALFGSIRANPQDCPNCIQSLLSQIPVGFLSSGKRSIPYDNLVMAIPPLQEGLLVYDLNLRLLREPANTNAPDQGYPPIRNVRIVPLP